MIINALNSGASAFMADFEDATSPTWANVVEGQVNLSDAVAGPIELETADKTYRVGPRPATLVVRPRRWHLPEQHREVAGAPGPGAGLDDRPVHARVRGAPRPHLSPPRRARDGRHGGVRPEPARPGGERDGAREGAGGQGPRGRRRLRRDVGRAPRPRRSCPR